MEANEVQVAGDHYKKHGELQHWDVVNHFELDYFQGQITRYVFRWKDKNGIEDLHKAAHYLQKYIELEIARKNGVESAPLDPGMGDGVALTNISHPTPTRHRRK
jgi:hypothetical protein